MCLNNFSSLSGQILDSLLWLSVNLFSQLSLPFSYWKKYYFIVRSIAGGHISQIGYSVAHWSKAFLACSFWQTLERVQRLFLLYTSKSIWHILILQTVIASFSARWTLIQVFLSVSIKLLSVFDWSSAVCRAHVTCSVFYRVSFHCLSRLRSDVFRFRSSFINFFIFKLQTSEHFCVF